MRQPAKQMGPRAVRTVAQILAATKEIFLTHGYTGTTVDEIARAAGISRASFYTYFPSKRDVLLTLGAESARAASTVVENAWEIRLPWRPADIENFVHSIWLIMDEHAAFGFAWTQASHQDEEIRILGMKGQIQVCQAMGQALGRLRGEPFDDPKSQGLIMFSALERAWDYCQIYTGSVDALSLQHAIAQVIQAMLRDTQKQEMS
jgi:AcrR family transcriptional regulator